MVKPNSEEAGRPSRRDFLKTSTAALAGGVAATFGVVPAVHAAGSDEIRVGLIGCGERGTGASQNVLESSPGVKLVAMGDVFKDHIEKSLKNLEKFADKIDVPEDRQFVGFDAYEKVLASDVNYVILATPPGFRPLHLKTAVAAGKNTFAEKPVGVDGPAIRSVLETYQDALSKGLAIGVGTQRRHQTGYLETLKRIHDGAIGDITEARVYWNQGPIWVHPRQEGWSDMEWQLRNWYYFTWLCGDHIVEQHVHNLDVANWAIGSHPIRAVGLGGRQVRTGPEYGNIYDHFAVDYEYDKGFRVASYCRQIPNCENNVSEALAGTKGFCQVNKYSITGTHTWKFHGEDNKPYVQEHTDLIAAIRAGKPYNELKQVAESTLTAILGRMAAYTGKAVTWEQALNSKEDLMPPKVDWDASLAVAPVAMPGQTELV
ncbi:MAG TPA: Gfo/Idh/MocA family oxidoreductase [Terriglobia bacterium]|nr:Gfo/Idh/MocA family oxidoreductase [Terriglobia bacterium]